MRFKHVSLCGLVLAAGWLPAMAPAGEVANYSPVTQQRLTKPEPGNWLLYRRTYDGHGYSPLDKINASNVKNLVPVWSFQTGVVDGLEATPLIVDGVIYLSTAWNHVFAIDARNGAELWHYKRRLPQKLSFCCGPTNRGVSIVNRTDLVARTRPGYYAQ